MAKIDMRATGIKRLLEYGRGALATPRLGWVGLSQGLILLPRHMWRGRKGDWKTWWKRSGASVVSDILQNSGPVFIKLGQIMASRQDLLGPELCQALSRLYDQQAPPQFRAVERELRRAYGTPLPFEVAKTPLGVGSIGAVYEARLKGHSSDGSPASQSDSALADSVVVKVLRPGVRAAVDRDFAVLRFLFVLASRSPRFAPYRRYVERALDDLEKGIRKETQLDLEREELLRFGRRFRKHPKVYVPRVFEELCRDHILVMEKVDGVPLSQLEPSDPRRVELGGLVFQEILEEIFIEGKFHADPHSGNFIVRPDGRLALIDFGLTGSFGEEDRQRIAKAVRAFMSRDAERVFSVLLEFGELSEGFDRERFQADIVTVVQAHREGVQNHLRGQAAQVGGLEKFVSELFLVAEKHRVFVAEDTVLFIKTLITVEGVARSLDPKLDVLGLAAPIVLKALAPKWVRAFWR